MVVNFLNSFTASARSVLGLEQISAASHLEVTSAFPAASSHGFLDLDTMSEAQVSRFLHQRASLWNFRRMAMVRPGDLEDDAERLLHMASFGEVLAAASEDTRSRNGLEKFLRQMGADAETLKFARDYVKEMARATLKDIPIGKREDRLRLASEFLQLALHARQEVAVCLFLAKRLANLSGLDWRGLVQCHREGRTDYEEELIDFIRAEGGSVPFDRYFDHAMFNPNHGTYTGKTADHLIAPDPRETSDAFFTTASYDPVLARSILSFGQRLWYQLGRPETFELVEMGAGMGFLAEAILTRIEALPQNDGFRRAVHYKIIEKSPALGAIQKDRLARFGHQVEIHCRSAIFGPLPRVKAGLIFSNELVDMFPPRKLVRSAGSLYEAYVTYRGGLIQETLGPVREETTRFLDDRHIVLNPGETFYIQPDIDAWIRNLEGALERGQVLTIDYGARRERLRRTRHEFGRSMFRGFLAARDPLNHLSVISLKSYRDSTTGVRRPKDMTVDVDFTSLEEAAAASGGFNVEPLITQKEFTLRICDEEPKIAGFNQCGVSILSKGL